MRILGVNDGHNAAACLYEDGHVVAAVQEERLRRVKNWSGLPTEAIHAVLGLGGISPADVDWVAMNGEHAAFPMTREALMEEYRTINDLGVTVRRGLRRGLRRLLVTTPVYRAYRERRQRARVRALLDVGVPSGRVVFVDHHAAHAAAAYYGWGRFDDDVLVLTLDGAGDGVCATVSVGRDGRLRRLHAIRQSESIGNLYAMATFLMGMVPLEHEHKLMGLAPYAEPAAADRVYEKLRALIRFDPDEPFGWQRSAGCPETYCSYRFLGRLLERERFDGIAGGLQRFTESVLVEWVRRCAAETRIRRVTLGGGVFTNVKANQRILELLEVDELFGCPSCGDEVNAMGAAAWVYAEKAGVAKMAPLRDLYWGREYPDDEIRDALDRFPFRSAVHRERCEPIEPRVAWLLAEGRIVARFKGREEFGARALGNRSILAHPSDPSVVRVLNEAVKARDFWMPFCPSILAERSADYFVNPKGIWAPYMILAFDTTARWREIAAAVHPFDRTVRPQEVSSEWNPAYHALLRDFERLTGIGAVLNTSFNLHGEPIVSRPRDALDVFDRSGLMHLAIGEWLLEKR